MSSPATRSGRGVRCRSSDGVPHASLQERDCYNWVRRLELRIRRFGRFDFIIYDSIVLEYHPTRNHWDRRSSREYYLDRRKLLDSMGHRNLKLVIMRDLDWREKERVKNFLFVNAPI